MNFLHTAHLVLTPLSPIHIGCGEDFEPTNYVIDDGVLYGFDPSRATLPEVLRKRLEELGNKADLLGIQRFFREQRQHFMPHAHSLIPVAAGVADEYEKRVGKVANQETNGNRVFNQLFIERASHTGLDQQPYIPGSSFKGALRTAKLDALNKGQRITDPDERRKSDRLEKRLLEGDFATSALRLLKAADFMPVAELAQQVLYGLNRKKDRVIDKATGQERQPKGIAARKQCIVGGQYRALQSTLAIQDLGPHADRKTTPSPALRPNNLSKVAQDTNDYHLPRLHAELAILDQRGMVSPGWKKNIEQLLGGELKTRLDQGQAFLIRLGRYGGAESKTLSGDGVAQIKIMQGKGQTPLYQSQTKTVWLAGQTADDQKHLIPFGWALVEIDPQAELPQLKAWCDAEAKNRPDMARIKAQFVQVQQENAAQKAALAQQQAEHEAAARAAAQAEANRQAALARMSPNQQRIEAFKLAFAARAEQLRGGYDKQNADYHSRARKLAQDALEGADWSADEKRAAADAIAEWLPKVVEKMDKDALKKLKLGTLRGQ